MVNNEHIVFAILIFFIGYIVARYANMMYHEYKRRDTSKNFVTWDRIKIPVIFLAIILAPLGFVNLTQPSYNVISPEKAVERAWKEKDAEIMIPYSRRLLEKDSANINSHFYFILAHCYLSDRYTREDIREFYAPYRMAKDPHLRDIGNLMTALGITWDPVDENVLPYLKKLTDQEMKYVPFAYGTFYLSRMENEKAEEYFRKSLKLEGFVQGSTRSLYSIYSYREDEEALHDLFYNEKAFAHLPHNERRERYYHDREWSWYFSTAFQRQEDSFNYFGLIAALFVTLVWVIYIRSIDVFEPEPWWAIALVFSMGAILTYLVYPMSDFLEFNYDFMLNGDPWNDWWYCFIGIGMVEEIAKLIPWAVFVFFIRKTREPFDFIVYASVSALGFAFTENLLYYQSDQLTAIDTRGLMSAIAHMFFASTVAYSFILMKHRYQNKKWAFLLPIAGFIIAAGAHGFYDYWLISPKVQVLWFLTYAFFMFSLHLWATMKNNALNNSTFFHASGQPIIEKVNLRLIFSMVGIFMVEYVIVGMAYGTSEANSRLLEGSVMTGLLIAYISSTFKGMELKQGVWKKFQSPLSWFSLPNFNDMGNEREQPPLPDLSGMHLRFFAPKTNKYVGDDMPVTGTLIERLRAGGDNNWYLVRLNQDVHFPGLVPNSAIVRHKTGGSSLKDDKVEIYFMMMPDKSVLQSSNIDPEELRYMGRVYSRPIDEFGNTIH